MRTPKAAVFALVLPFVLAITSLGCSNQGEGERCDRRNNNDDCESGLVCTSKETLKSNSDLCCPPAPRVPSVAECTPGAGGGSAPPDASTGGEPDAGDAGELADAEADAAEEDAEATDATADDAEADDAATDDAATS